MSNRKYTPGYYRARGIAGTDQHGYASGGGEQISVELDVQISDQEMARLTTILAFSGKAAPISIDRLKALGWTGSAALPLEGINANEVEVELKYEVPPGKTEEQLRVEIKTGGRFTFKQPMSEPEKRGFMANLAKQAAQLAQGAPQPAPQPQRPPPQGDSSGTNFPHGANAPPPQGNYRL